MERELIKIIKQLNKHKIKYLLNIIGFDQDERIIAP